MVELTDRLADALKDVTVNTPDWSTLRFIQSARRLYKPTSAQLTPRQYVKLNRRFANQYIKERNNPELQALTADLENYQARLDLLGLKDHQLRQPVTLSHAFRKIVLRERHVARVAATCSAGRDPALANWLDSGRRR